jgi:hypothetical protein
LTMRYQEKAATSSLLPLVHGKSIDVPFGTNKGETVIKK